MGPNGVVDLSIGRGPYTNPYGDPTLIQAVKSHAENLEKNGTLIVQDDGSDMDYNSWGLFMDKVNEIVQDDVCIVWVAPFSAFSRDRDIQILNAMNDHRGGQPRSVIARWDLKVEENPPLYAPDGKHPEGGGEQAFADVVVAAANSCP